MLNSWDYPNLPQSSQHVLGPPTLGDPVTYKNAVGESETPEFKRKGSSPDRRRETSLKILIDASQVHVPMPRELLPSSIQPLYHFQ